ncbi:MAG: CBS domain-containing protein [Pseudomonadota bacterium]
MAARSKVGVQLRDRPEFHNKPKPLTMSADATVFDAVKAMSEKNFGSIFIVDDDSKVVGVMTERDVMRKVVGEDRDAKTTTLDAVMTRNPRVAKETDDVLDWLRIMSNDRFRRLPVVDADNRIQVVFTQGDFVSYTWPDLVFQASQLARATFARNYAVWLVGGGIALYTLLMIIVVRSL